MAFDLAKAAGLESIVSNLDIMEVTMIPLGKIDVNEKNFFSVDDVQDLAESIQVNGILQPLNVVRAGDRYRIIAGHRRFKAAGEAGLKEVPAIVLPEMSEAMEWFMLIKTNTTARELSYLEKAESAARLKKHLVQMKKEGVKITGRLRDIVSEQLEISKTELARMEVVEKNLIPEAKELLRTNQLNPSAAYAMARTDNECQHEILANPKLRAANDIEDYAERRKHEWVCTDCPIPTGFWMHEAKEKGELVSCPAWRQVLQHKEKGHPESCPGCCAKCVSYDHGYCCPDVCMNAREARNARIAKERQKQASDQALADQQTAKEHFLRTPFVAIGPAILHAIEKHDMTFEEFADLWSDNLGELLPPCDDFDPFDESHVASAARPEVVCDIDWPLAAFLALCRAADCTPNDMLGYSSYSGWKQYPDEKPADGQHVVARRQVGSITRCGEYIYRNGEWYEPALDDFKMNISGVTHWIEAPDDT